jgi:excisionase family DNA binding protein
MSSNIEIKKYCECCGNEFTAKTTVTRYCGDVCAKRAYKARKRAEKINVSIVEVAKKKEQKPFQDISKKEYLNVKEVCELFGISRRTIYRLFESGEIEKIKIRSRTIVKRSDLNKLTEFQKRIESEIKIEPKQYEIIDCYTISEVQEKFKVSETALQNIIKREAIPKMQKGKFVYVPKVIINDIFK